MPRRALVAALAAVVSLAVIAAAAFVLLGDGDSKDELRPSAMTPQELYAAVDQKLAEAEGVLHLKTASEFSGPYQYTLAAEVWIDGSRQLMREHLVAEAAGTELESKALLTSTERYEVQPGRPHTPPGGDNGSSVTTSKYSLCYDAGVAASALLRCAGQDVEGFQQRVEEGTRKGRKIIVLVTVSRSNSEARGLTTSRLYLDASTLLPVAAESEGAILGRIPFPTRSTTKYERVEFVALTTLAGDFFEPSGIGWQARDPEVGMRNVNDLQRYWLGREFTPPGFETLILQTSEEEPGRGSPYRYSLTYARKSAPHEPPFVTLMVFHLDMWQRSPAIQSQSVTLGDVVVFFVENKFPDQQGIISSPGGLEGLIQGLRPYEPSP